MQNRQGLFNSFIFIVQFSRSLSLVRFRDSLIIISHRFEFVKYFFQIFLNFFLDRSFRDICFSAACLLYHTLFGLSSTFFKFFSNFFRADFRSAFALSSDSLYIISSCVQNVNTHFEKIIHNIFSLFFNFLYSIFTKPYHKHKKASDYLLRLLLCNIGILLLCVFGKFGNYPHKAINVCELSVNRRKTYIRNVIYIFQLVQYHFTDLVRGYLSLE